MRSAEEWYKKINSYSNPKFMNDVPREWVLRMINEARRETIVECAKRAQSEILANLYEPSDPEGVALSIMSLSDNLK